MDAQLHAERVDPETRLHRLHQARLDDLPDGAFVLVEGAPRLVLGRRLLAWTAAGYVDPVTRPVGGESATLVTPPSLVAVLRSGWAGAVPLLHPTAAVT